MNNLFSKFNVPIVSRDIESSGAVGQYCSKEDVIIIDKNVMKSFPIMKNIIVLHEMFHSTLSSTRTNRIERLVSKLGQYKLGSESFKTEECIAEICTMIACKKLGLLNKYTSIVIEDGIKKNYNDAMIIPWMEVVSALRYFCDDSMNFDDELQYVKLYLTDKYNMKIGRSYDSSSIKCKHGNT